MSARRSYGSDDYSDDYGDDPPKHTQFLDLTNGEGGEGPLTEYEDDDDDGETGSPMAGNSSSLSGTIDPSTPGRVVDAGQEHTGRWTKGEHEAFLSALRMYGKEWKKVAAKVKTRTVVQTRTHAQKYFQKLQKAVEQSGKEEVTHVEMGVAAEAKKASALKKKRSTPIAPKLNRRSSQTTISAAQVISNLSVSQPIGPYVATGSSASMTGAAQPRHGFSTEPEDHFSSSYPSWMSGGRMKIVAPDPEIHKSKLPEPSPAATGKRKLAEIAAARMLAGVAGSARDSDGPPTPPPPETPGMSLNLKEAPPPPLFGGGASSPSKKSLSLQIVNPESLGVSYDAKRRRVAGGDSPVTPWDGQLEALVSEEARNESKGEEEKKMSDSKPSATKVTGASHPVCGPADAFGRSSLHRSVCLMDIEVLETEVSSSGSVAALHRLDEAGYAPIHTASSLCIINASNASACSEMVKMLTAAGVDPSAVDSKGNSPLHWAARAGDRDVAEFLIVKNCPLDGKNQAGETPLHWAMRAGQRSAEVVAVLLEAGARAAAQDSSFRRPVDVAADGFVDEPGSVAACRHQDSQQPGKATGRQTKKATKEKAGERRDSRANFLLHSNQSRSLVLHHPECLDHRPKSSTDWEVPDRVSSILRRVIPSSDATGTTETSGIFPHEVTISKDFDRAKLDLLSRVHSTNYLSFVNKLSKDLEKQLKDAGQPSMDDSDGFRPSAGVVPFTPLVQRSMVKFDEANIKLGMNSDTSFSVGSLRAARRAAGAVQHAVDCVLVGRNRNAFCVVRPPGHHAGINGLLEGGESCGFCIFNSVAAGALYATSDDRLACTRCAIVDIDVHHGNGTEEIVRNCQDPNKLFFFSIHLYDNDKKKRSANQFSYKFYPGTGSEDDLALNIINVPIVPLWKEPAPPAQTAKTHNTRHKTRAPNDDSSDNGTPRNSDNASEAGSATTSTSPVPPGTTSSGRAAYRQAIQSRLLPALRAFNPDLILISAGFDASKGDVGNARHERGGRERMGLDLEPEDYAWTTRKILEIADICCQGRVVSVLEGGYGRTPRDGRAVEEEGLDRAIFSECAVRHLHAMIDPYDVEGRFS